MTIFIKKITAFAVSAAMVLGLGGMGSVTAQAQDASVPNQTINTTLNSLNDSGASGTSEIELLDDNQVRVKVNVTGTSPSLPHAQHLHYIDSDTQISSCPAPSADKDGDGIINTVEGQPAYGEIIVSLTTEGGVGPDSGLAVDRFPVADENGNLNYERTFELPEGVSREDVTESVVVHHGISELFDDKAKYDGEKKSPLDPELPLEATVPAACGAFETMPTGGADTGSGSTAGIENSMALAIGASAIVVGGGILLASRRKITQ